MIGNLDKINLLKRKKVENGIKFIDNYNRKNHCIDKVMIFGSSTRDDCTENSDIDICLFSKCDLSDVKLFDIFGELPFVVGQNCDILSFNDIGSDLQKIIMDNGIVVYEYK